MSEQELEPGIFPSALLCSLKHVCLRGMFQVLLLPYLGGAHGCTLNKREDQQLVQASSLLGRPRPMVLCCVFSGETWKARTAFLGPFCSPAWWRAG